MDIEIMGTQSVIQSSVEDGVKILIMLFAKQKSQLSEYNLLLMLASIIPLQSHVM